MTEPGQRRSRTAWPGPLSVAGVGSGHTHDLPKALLSRARLLLVAVIALLLAVGTLTYFVYQQQQYIQGRGEYRDAEAARMERENAERLRRGICDLLDQLPEGGFLDRPRAKYDCGPGIPIEALTPEEQAQLNGRAAPSVGPPSEVQQQAPQPPVGTPAVPVPPRTLPAEPPTLDPAPAPQVPVEPSPPTPAPQPPIVDLSPLTDPLCGALRLCF